MIQSIHIQNFKSVVDLSLDLGRFNVLIGENGCGKSNILEAIAFGAAAGANKLDYEFMGSRGIRLTNPEFMYSAFANLIQETLITLEFTTESSKYHYKLEHNTSGKWKDKFAEELFTTLNNNKLNDNFNDIKTKYNQLKSKHGDTLEEEIPSFLNLVEHIELLETLFHNIQNQSPDTNLSNFIIYSPEESRLRKFEDSDHIYPLGIKGQGLFQYLKEFTLDSKNKAAVQEIKDTLALLDWYKDFGLPDNLMRNEFALSIQDKYLDERLRYFDQRSTNEGFLFLLFYATLFISDLTPTFFAIDNIEASFNPKLCTELISTLVQLAKKHNKQVIVTTHNPAVLDGLDLHDDSQRLFVVRRNDEGHTRARRIEHKPERTMKLSEIWTKGFIGGLPDNF